MEIKDVMFAVGFVTTVLLLLLGFLLFFFLKYRARSNKFIKERETMKKTFEQTLLQSQVEVQEATFSVLAKELHDNVGQLLSSSKMLMGVAQRNLINIPETLTIAEETLGKAINELRSLSKSLDKQLLEQFDLINNLSAEIKRINSSLELKIHFLYSGKLAITPEKQIILFRIIQESLQNAIKHAQAKNINIEIETTAENIIIYISDDGKGFKQIANNGLGIRNMKHRAKLLGGNITWAAAEKGTLITIRLPVKKLQDEN
ncbi:MAG: sensor histidine kinase [Ginsengibacter sp.]